MFHKGCRMTQTFEPEIDWIIESLELSACLYVCDIVLCSILVVSTPSNLYLWYSCMYEVCFVWL